MFHVKSNALTRAFSFRKDFRRFSSSVPRKKEPPAEADSPLKLNFYALPLQPMTFTILWRTMSRSAMRAGLRYWRGSN